MIMRILTFQAKLQNTGPLISILLSINCALPYMLFALFFVTAVRSVVQLLVEHRDVTREVVSSSPTCLTLRVFK